MSEPTYCKFTAVKSLETDCQCNGRVSTWVASHLTGYYVDVVPNGFGSKKNNQKCLFYQAVVYQTTSKPLATQEDVEAAIAEVMITQP